MAKVLKLKVHYSAVSNYEKGSREPDLLILLRYARLTGAPMENLVDDSFDLWLGAGIPKDAIIELPPPRPTKKRPKP
jgi:transcriptional regulator with XRE-family HTH domain